MLLLLLLLLRLLFLLLLLCLGNHVVEQGFLLERFGVFGDRNDAVFWWCGDSCVTDVAGCHSTSISRRLGHLVRLHGAWLQGVPLDILCVADTVADGGGHGSVLRPGPKWLLEARW